MLTRLYGYLLIAALMAGLGAGTVWYWASARLAKKDAQITALQASAQALAKARKDDAALLARRARANALARRETAALRLRLDAALAAQPEWASQPVPKEVRDALR